MASDGAWLVACVVVTVVGLLFVVRRLERLIRRWEEPRG